MQCKFLQVFSVTGYPLPFWQKNIQTGGLPNHPYVYFMLDKAQDWCFCLSWTDWRLLLTIVGQATALSPVHSILICLLL